MKRNDRMPRILRTFLALPLTALAVATLSAQAASAAEAAVAA